MAEGRGGCPDKDRRGQGLDGLWKTARGSGDTQGVRDVTRVICGPLGTAPSVMLATLPLCHVELRRNVCA